MADKLELKVVFSAVDKFLRPANAITAGARAASKELKVTKDALKALNDQQKLVDNFRGTNRALGIDGAKLEAARAQVKKIGEAMAATTAPSAQMQRSFAAARQEAAQLSANVNRLAESKQRVRHELVAAGIDTKQLARVMSIPAGGESTGLHAVDEINGWTYIMSNFQHAGDWGGIHNVVKGQLDPLINANYKNKSGAAVGYLTGTPTQMKLG